MAKDTPTAIKTTVAKTVLPSEIFAVDVPNHELLKLAYDSYLANSRLATATTKQRGEVSGGGIVFGPRGNENYTKRVSTTSKRVALRQALTLAHTAGKIVVLDFKTTGKTSETVKFLADNKLDRKVLIVVDEKTPEIIRATNNIQSALLIRANYLSVYHILNADHIVLSTPSIAVIQKWLTKEEK
jgi:large subunit ribosomal protein L4